MLEPSVEERADRQYAADDGIAPPGAAEEPREVNGCDARRPQCLRGRDRRIGIQAVPPREGASAVGAAVAGRMNNLPRNYNESPVAVAGRASPVPVAGPAVRR